MDPAVGRVLVVAAATGALAAAGAALASPWDLVAVQPWMLALGGPLVLWLMQPALARDERAWAVVVALALPGVAVAAAVRETLHVSAYAPAPETVVRHGVSLAIHGVWLALTVLLAARCAWKTAPERRWALGGFAAAALLVALVAHPIVLLILLELAAVAALARFSRPLAAWGRAVVAAAVVAGAGLLALGVASGPTWPPRLILDEVAFGLGVMPLVAGAGLAFVATLFVRAPTAP